MIKYGVKLNVEGLGNREFKNVVSDGSHPDRQQFYYVHLEDDTQHLYPYLKILELSYDSQRMSALKEWQQQEQCHKDF